MCEKAGVRGDGTRYTPSTTTIGSSGSVDADALTMTEGVTGASETTSSSVVTKTGAGNTHVAVNSAATDHDHGSQSVSEGLSSTLPESNANGNARASKEEVLHNHDDNDQPDSGHVTSPSEDVVGSGGEGAKENNEANNTVSEADPPRPGVINPAQLQALRQQAIGYALCLSYAYRWRIIKIEPHSLTDFLVSLFSDSGVFLRLLVWMYLILWANALSSELFVCVEL